MVRRQHPRSDPEVSGGFLSSSLAFPSTEAEQTGMERPVTKYKFGTPYIPSYMDLSNGPEPCVVCGDAATGYHYRCMTCEGCKGFFRRTIQKGLSYHCKWNGECAIDKTTRNQCQLCRYKKCINAGMAPDLVLNENQRRAKRRLIQENRDKRTREEMVRQGGLLLASRLTESEENLIQAILVAHQETTYLFRRNSTSSDEDGGEPDTKRPKVDDDRNSLQNLAEIMTPSIVKVVEFAKRVPGFKEMNHDDQVLLLKSCCMEIMCLRIAQKYDPESQRLIFSNGMPLDKSGLKQDALSQLVEPIYDFAVGLSRLRLTETELALLAAVLLIAGDRPGLKDPKSVEILQDTLLTAFQHFINETRPTTPVHWAKILMKITDLRTISARHAQRLLCVKLDKSQEIPQMFLEMFDYCNTTL